MSRLAKQIEKRLLKLAANKRMNLSDGTTFSQAQFVRTFKGIFPNLEGADASKTRDAMKFVRAYSEINRVLAAKGIKIKASNYYSEFKIQAEKDSIQRAVAKMTKAAEDITNASETLRLGFMKNKGIMTKGLTKTEMKTAVARIGKPIF